MGSLLSLPSIFPYVEGMPVIIYQNKYGEIQWRIRTGSEFTAVGIVPDPNVQEHVVDEGWPSCMMATTSSSLETRVVYWCAGEEEERFFYRAPCRTYCQAGWGFRGVMPLRPYHSLSMRLLAIPYPL